MFSLVFRAIRVASPTPPILQATQQATCEESTSPLHPVILPDHLFYPLGPLMMDCADLLLSFSPVFPTAAFLPFPFLSLSALATGGVLIPSTTFCHRLSTLKRSRVIHLPVKPLWFLCRGRFGQNLLRTLPPCSISISLFSASLPPPHPTISRLPIVWPNPYIEHSIDAFVDVAVWQLVCPVPLHDAGYAI